MRLRYSSPRLLADRSGFTLLEVLLAVALGAFIMTAVVTFVFSMAELWGAGANERLFKKHARGVARFLEQSLQVASSRYGEEQNRSPVFWMNWEGDANERVEYLSFELEKGPGALVWPSEPLPHVVCSVDFDRDEGLFLLWRSRLEEGFEKDPPRRTLISPFVSEVRYHYIDYEEENPQWEIETTPKQEADQSFILPQRVELVFNFKGEQVTRQLSLPSSLEGTPIF